MKFVQMNIANLRSDPDFLAFLGIRFRQSRGLLSSMLSLSVMVGKKRIFFLQIIYLGLGFHFLLTIKQPINHVFKT